MTLPDGRVVAYTYDANGNRTSVKPPGRSRAPLHLYGCGQACVIRCRPAVAGAGATTYTYDVDRRLTAVTRPGGRTIRYGYDAAGRLASIAAPTGTTTFVYEAGDRPPRRRRQFRRVSGLRLYWLAAAAPDLVGHCVGERGSDLFFGLLGRLAIG